MKVSINNNIINNQTDSRMLMTSNSKINNSVDIVQVNNLSSFNNKQQIEYENLSEAILNPSQDIQKQIIDDNNREKYNGTERNLLFGHSASYYSDFKNCYMEIIAETSSLYNGGNLKLLYEYLPTKHANAFVNAYEKLLDYSDLQKSLSKFKQDCDSAYGKGVYFDNLLIDFDVLSLSDKMFLSSIDNSMEYLQIQRNKFGQENLDKIFTDYVVNRDINIFDNLLDGIDLSTNNLSTGNVDNLKKYVSLLNDNNIYLFQMFKEN